jgi:hypothetical protein
MKEIETLTRVYKRRMADLRVIEERLNSEFAEHKAIIASE